MMWVQAMKGAGIYAVAMAGVGFASGEGLNITNNLLNGAMMGGAVLGDEVTHSMLSLDPSVASSAVMTGAWFAGLEALLRGDTRYARNAAAGAVTGVVLDAWY
jgi:hypothetical protein